MPADFVNKLQRMFQDIKVSDDLNHEFKEAHRNNNEGIAGTVHCVNIQMSTDTCFVIYVYFSGHI